MENGGININPTGISNSGNSFDSAFKVAGISIDQKNEINIKIYSRTGKSKCEFKTNLFRKRKITATTKTASAILFTA